MVCAILRHCVCRFIISVVMTDQLLSWGFAKYLPGSGPAEITFLRQAPEELSLPACADLHIGDGQHDPLHQDANCRKVGAVSCAW